ncbi:kinase [Thraustotheca clavata]|uniref:Kinase n=1 Tax=Thraustotheca clavata TaxID=74557 RepID=A0A1W0A905_9STRA|nr:kinase [Thraustotheca clavata]
MRLLCAVVLLHVVHAWQLVNGSTQDVTPSPTPSTSAVVTTKPVPTTTAPVPTTTVPVPTTSTPSPVTSTPPPSTVSPAPTPSPTPEPAVPTTTPTGNVAPPPTKSPEPSTTSPTVTTGPPTTKTPSPKGTNRTSSGSSSGSKAAITPGNTKQEDSSNSNVVTYAAIGASVFVVLVAIVAFVLYRQKKAAEREDARTSITPQEYYSDRRSSQPLSYGRKTTDTSYRASVDTKSSQKSTQRQSMGENSKPGTNGSIGEINQIEGYDIRFDKSMSNFRVANEEVELFDVLARGGFGVIYRGRFAGEDVAVKKCLPEKVNNHEAMEAFMCEIKLMSKLDHPNIVRFVGVAWTTLLQLKMLTEYQVNGNVRSLLLDDKARNPRTLQWFQGEYVTKLRIASDVAEALVYLHTATPPIIHRDLKSSNVLLGKDYQAKLTDFGTSRELSDENTMTAEIGTLAWIAPEIMLGGHYTERADIYSFGVLLNELDLADLPYSNVTSDGFISHTRLGVMVAGGKIAPKFSDECPEAIVALGTECLRFEAKSRPTAMQIAYRLRQLMKNTRHA